MEPSCLRFREDDGAIMASSMSAEPSVSSLGFDWLALRANRAKEERVLRRGEDEVELRILEVS